MINCMQSRWTQGKQASETHLGTDTAFSRALDEELIQEVVLFLPGVVSGATSHVSGFWVPHYLALAVRVASVLTLACQHAN